MARAELGKYPLKLKLKLNLSNMKETFGKDCDLFWSVKIRQTNKSLTKMILLRKYISVCLAPTEAYQLS